MSLQYNILYIKITSLSVEEIDSHPKNLSGDAQELEEWRNPENTEQRWEDSL